MSLLAAFFGPLAAALLLTAAVVQKAKRPFGQAAPIAFFAAPLMLYLAMLAGFAKAGYAVLLAGCVYGGVCLVRSVRRGGPLLGGLWLTPGLLAFLLFYCYLFAISYGRGFIWWDEISHWGPMVKESLRLDDFYAAAQSNLSIHKDYPPFICLLQVLWCRVGGGYSEGRLYCALLTFCHVLFLPVFEQTGGQSRAGRALRTVLGCVLTVLACSLIGGDVPFYASIYTDSVLGLLLAYCLSRVALRDRLDGFDILSLTLGSTALLMTKQMGVAFFLMVLGLLAARLLWDDWTGLKKRSAPPRLLLKSTAGCLLPVAAVPLLFSQSWKWVLAAEGLTGEGQFEFSALQIGRLWNIYNLTDGRDFQQAAAHNFLSALFRRNLWAAGAGHLKMTYMGFFVLFAALFALYTLWAAGRRGLPQLLLLDAVALGGSGGYALAMLTLYVFSFGSYEGPNLASYSRYMNTYWFAMLALLFMLVWAEAQRLTTRRLLAAGAAVGLAITADLAVEWPDQLGYLLPASQPGDSARYAAEAAFVQENTPEQADVFVVTQQGNGYENFIMQYLLLPRNVNDKLYSVGQVYTLQDLWTIDISPEEYAEVLHEYDYVYILAADEEYRDAYGALYADGDPQTGELYRVDDRTLTQAAAQDLE